MIGRLKFLSFLLYSALFCASCVENLGLFKGEESFYIVDGGITNEYGPHAISITKTAEFNTVSDQSDMVDAQAQIVDDLGEIVRLREIRFGYFETPNDFRGLEGRAYRLEVLLASGLRIVSDMEPLVASPVIDDFSYHLIQKETIGDGGVIFDQRYVEFLTSFCDQGKEDNYYKWEYKGTYEYQAFLEASPFDIEERRENGTQKKYCWKNILGSNYLKIRSDLLFDGNCLEDFPLFDKSIDGHFQIGLYMELQQYGITHTEYDYLSALKSQYDNKGTIFETGNYQITGNLHVEDDGNDLILGFFSVRSLTRKSLFIRPEEVFYSHQYSTCTARGFTPPPVSCYDCRSSVLGTENIKPSYWPN